MAQQSYLGKAGIRVQWSILSCKWMTLGNSLLAPFPGPWSALRLKFVRLVQNLPP